VATLRTADDELRDLARGTPWLEDADTGADTGLRLERWLGSGGMSSVFLATLDPVRRSSQLSPLTPPRVAVKVMKPGMDLELRRMNLSSTDLFKKELVALGRVMERSPPTEYVIGLYGSGRAQIEHPNGIYTLPWLALEVVDGGRDGATLRDRVERQADGIDPVRALRLVRGIFSGLEVLHEVGILHRDIKPDNVFVAGPLDDETPKVADCGIARVQGMSAGTIAALTPAYGGPEQVLSSFNPTVSNPLVGTWTDVHALAAVVWFMLGGEEWCRSTTDRSWHAGVRRSLRTAARLHRGFALDARLMDALDAVLARGTAHRLPAQAEAGAGDPTFARLAHVHFAQSMFAGPHRYATVGEFAGELLPVLERAASAWIARGAREQHPATVFRATVVAASLVSGGQVTAEVHEVRLPSFPGGGDPPGSPIQPGAVVFQPDGSALARFGPRLMYLLGDRAHKVAVPGSFDAIVRDARWITRGPSGGFALLSPTEGVLIRGGVFSPLKFPVRPPRPGGSPGGPVGRVVMALGDGRAFAVITEGVDASDDEPELWSTSDGVHWADPIAVPLGGDVRAMASGPYGLLLVGAKGGKRARALAVGPDGQVTLYVSGMGERPPLTACTCGALRESWGAGRGCVLRFDGSTGQEEITEDHGEPVGMALDLVGVPWLVTERAILRRQESPARWRVHYQRREGDEPLVAIGFTPLGARVLDARGAGALIIPSDIAQWRGG
jgi:hypothetical protein